VSIGQRTLQGIDRFQRRHAWAGFPFAVVRKYGDDQAGYLAALIAYYGFFSVFPLMLVFVSVLGIVLANSPQLQQEIIDSALAQFPIVGPTIAEEVHAITGDAAALTIGLVTALWAGLGVVQASQNAMNQVWDVPRKDRPNFFISRLRSLLMLFVLGTTLLASTLFSGLATARSSNGAVLVTWEIGVSLLFNLVLFLIVYRVLTRLDLRWRDVLPGSIAAAISWTVLQGVGGYYVEHTIKTASNVYGTLALVIGLLVWIYLGGQLTLLCAEINVVRIRRLWPRSLAPPLTEADQRVMRAGTLTERRRPEQHITVTFETEAEPSGSKGPPGRDEA
jgi:YihY family inner membrane protein